MKSRRDITLGEMQDECKTRKVCETANEKCSYYGVCAFFHRIAPSKINLSDPPRFNEAQMALLKALCGLGFVSIENIGSGAFKTASKDGKTGMFMTLLGIEDGETLDLAELFGEGADK